MGTASSAGARTVQVRRMLEARIGSAARQGARTWRARRRPVNHTSSSGHFLETFKHLLVGVELLRRCHNGSSGSEDEKAETAGNLPRLRSRVHMVPVIVPSDALPVHAHAQAICLYICTIHTRTYIGRCMYV